MQVEIPNFNIKKLNKRLKSTGFTQIQTDDFFLLASYFKKKSDIENSWFTVYARKLEDITPHFVELITFMCNQHMIKIIDNGDGHKLQVKLNSEYKDTTRIITL